MSLGWCSHDPECTRHSGGLSPFVQLSCLSPEYIHRLVFQAFLTPLLGSGDASSWFSGLPSAASPALFQSQQTWGAGRSTNSCTSARPTAAVALCKYPLSKRELTHRHRLVGMAAVEAESAPQHEEIFMHARSVCVVCAHLVRFTGAPACERCAPPSLRRASAGWRLSEKAAAAR